MSNPQPDTNLPQETGLYLFIGVRSGATLDRIDRYPPRPELVSVSRDDKGKLRYIGRDFFYHPALAVGAWVPVDVSDLRETANVVLHDLVMRKHVAKFNENTWRAHNRDEFIAWLTEKPLYGGAPPVDSPNLAAWLAHLAVEAGLLLDTPPESTI